MKSLMLIFIFLFNAVTLQGAVWQATGPEGFEAKITVPDGKLIIPNEFEVALDLIHPADYELDLQTLRANLLRNGSPEENPFTLISQEHETNTQANNNSVTTHVKFKMEPQQPGPQVITPMNIRFIAKSGQEPKIVEIIADIFPLDVVLPNKQKNLNPNQVAAPMLSFEETLPIALDFDMLVKLKENPELLDKEARKNAELLKSKHLPWNALGGILGVILIWAIMKNAPRKAKEAHLEVKQSEASFQEAQAKLKELEQENNPDPELVDDYFVQLSNAVRYRIEEQFNLKAPVQTSQEFLAALETHPIFNDATRGLLHDFLESTDQVKFAQHRPTLEECRQAQQTARAFLEKA